MATTEHPKRQSALLVVGLTKFIFMIKLTVAFTWFDLDQIGAANRIPVLCRASILRKKKVNPTITRFTALYNIRLYGL